MNKDPRYYDEMGDLIKEALCKPCNLSLFDGKPLVAVIHSWTEISPGDMHMKDMAKIVKKSVKKAGAIPVEINIPGSCGDMKANTFVRRYFFPYRDFAAAIVEFMLRLHGFDGAVFMCTCDNQVPAFVLGALRVNIPSIFVTGGYMQPGVYRGREITAFDVAKEYGKYVAGESTKTDLQELVNAACPSPGACPEMGTANTMCVITEALGLTLPGCASVPANSEKHRKIAYASGKEIVKAIKNNVTPRKIVTKEALENAIRVCLSVGGSTNAVIHTIAYGKEAKLPVTIDTWDHLSQTTPLVCAISPNQRGFTMKDFDAAGGVLTVMKVLSPLLDKRVLRISNTSLSAEISQIEPVYGDILKPLDKPFSVDGGLIVVKGNLAKKGAIIKKSAFSLQNDIFTGPAKVFNCEEDAREAVLKGRIKKGNVIVVRYEGPRACPGSREMINILHCLVGMNMHESVALLTDGRVSGTNLGFFVCNISPEAIDGTPLAVVVDGDMIEIDLAKRTLNLLVAPEEITRRLSVWEAPKPVVSEGILSLYSKVVSPLSEGACII